MKMNKCNNCKRKRPDNWTDIDGKHHYGCSGTDAHFDCKLFEEKYNGV